MVLPSQTQPSCHSDAGAPSANIKPQQAVKYEVKEGETLFGILKSLGQWSDDQFKAVLELNRKNNNDLGDGSKLSIGQTIYLFAADAERCPAGSPSAKPQLPPASQPALAGYVQYTVKEGDTLFRILNDRHQWGQCDKIKELNNITDESYLKAGLVINLPPESSKTQLPPVKDPAFDEYLVKRGDSLWGILYARGQLKQFDTVLEKNEIGESDVLKTGQTLLLPKCSAKEPEAAPQPAPPPEKKTPPVVPHTPHARGDVYSQLKSYIGCRYGPKYPVYLDPKKKHLESKPHYDCVSLPIDYFKKYRGIALTGSRGDQFLHRHCRNIKALQAGSADLSGLKPGQLVCFGGYSEAGEGGYDVRHLGVVAAVEKDQQGKITDAVIVHASGTYSKDRTTWKGAVKEESLQNMMRRYQGTSRSICFVADVCK